MARRKSWLLAILAAVAPIAVVTSSAFRADAFPEGSAFTNCISCHAAPPSFSATTNVVIAAPTSMTAGGTYAIYVYVTNAMYRRFGFSLHASTGTFYATSPSATTTVIAGDGTHSCRATACPSDGCTASFYTYWIAPSASASTVTFSAYGLAHDGNATACPGSAAGAGSTGDVTGVAIDRTSEIVCSTGGFEGDFGASHRCGSECVSDEDPAHCGTSCVPCIAPTGGTVRCVGFPYACVAQCPLDTHLCGDACVADSPTSCGSACATCPAPEHATATCTVGVCGFTCEDGMVACGGKCITGTCAGFDGGIDAFDAGRDTAIDTMLPDEDTAPKPKRDSGADAGPTEDDASSGCGCATPGRAGTHGGALAALGALLVIARRRYKRMSM